MAVARHTSGIGINVWVDFGETDDLKIMCYYTLTEQMVKSSTYLFVRF